MQEDERRPFRWTMRHSVATAAVVVIAVPLMLYLMWRIMVAPLIGG